MTFGGYFKALVAGVALVGWSRAPAVTPSDSTVAPGAVIAGGVVRLPEFHVVQRLKLRPLEDDWLYGRIGEFEILSNASEKATRRWAESLARFEQVFAWMMPRFGVAGRRPVELVLCGRRNAFDQFRPASAYSSYRDSVSFYAMDADQAVIVEDLEDKTVWIRETHGIGRADNRPYANPLAAPPATQDPAGRAEVPVDSEQALRREYVHLVLSQLRPRAPAWFAEGMAQLFSTVEVAPKAIRFAHLPGEFVTIYRAVPNTTIAVPAATEPVSELSLFFEKRRLLPLPDLFAVGYDSPAYLDPIGSTFAMESFAFVHLCLFGEKQRYVRPFLEFVEQAGRQPVTDAMFERCFGMNFAQMGRILRGYLRGGSYQEAVAPNPGFPPVPAVSLRKATYAEIARIKGDAMRLARRYDDADEELLSAVVRGQADAQVYASLGLLERAERNPDAMWRLCDRAVKDGASLPGPYLYLARYRLDQALATAGPEGRLGTADTASLLTLLMAARERALKPRPEIYRTIAEVWSHAAAAPTAADLTVLDEGVAHFPQEVDLVCQDAALKAALGLRAEATALIERGLRAAPAPGDRTRLEALRSALSSATPRH